jgi:hypothetical protein
VWIERGGICALSFGGHLWADEARRTVRLVIWERVDLLHVLKNRAQLNFHF